MAQRDNQTFGRTQTSLAAAARIPQAMWFCFWSHHALPYSRTLL